MNTKIMKLVGISVVVAIVLLVAVVAANAQGTCVLHPAGDAVPCSHVVCNAYGCWQAHAFDVIPCVHYVPCYDMQDHK